ncbi:MAG: ATP-binding protein [Promethearchaeota archaeon]
MRIYHFPFSAILGQDRMKLALVLNIIDSKIGGVLLTGQQGTGKSTAVRSLVEILPEIQTFEGCQFQCNPAEPANYCAHCKELIETAKKSNKTPKIITKPINLVTLPLGATEEMVMGSLDIEQIIREGKKEILPGLLAKAHKGILYVDEINLLQDHLIDILLDVSASDVNIIEREGISLSHPSDFILVGSMNPEEGELRPQISDRLGLEIQIQAPEDPKIRAEITERVIAFADNPAKFCEKYESYQMELREKIKNAKELLSQIPLPSFIYQFTAELVLKLGLYSQRADITYIRCVRAFAAYSGHQTITREDLFRAMHLVFKHRITRFNENLAPDFLNNSFEDVFKALDAKAIGY